MESDSFPTGSDEIALAALRAALADGRARGDERPSLAVIAEVLAGLGVRVAPVSAKLSLREARAEWLDRLRSANRSRSSLGGYRVAIDDLADFLERTGMQPDEVAVVAYLNDYRGRAAPAEATYYRRFMLLRRFFRWYASRAGIPDPFLDLEPPPKPRQEADWLTTDEVRRLLAAAATPARNREGLADRDQLVLFALVATGLRRSELLALDWGDLDLQPEHPSALVRRGKGGKPRRQPLAPELARRLAARHTAIGPAAGDPVFCGLQGKRLQEGILAEIIRRAAARAGLDKHVTAHTLRHTAATWLRQQTGDARLVAEYLGHADLSTVSRYAHVAEEDLHAAARALDGALQTLVSW